MTSKCRIFEYPIAGVMMARSCPDVARHLLELTTMRVFLAFTALSLALLIGLQFVDEPRAARPFEDYTVAIILPDEDGRGMRERVYDAGHAAESDLGCRVEPILVTWTGEGIARAVQQLATAQSTGICIMGYPADESLLSSLEDALDLEVPVTTFNSRFPPGEDRASGNGFGFVGLDGYKTGYALGKMAIRKHGLQPGDTGLIFGDLTHVSRTPFRDGCLAAFEEAGLRVNQYNISMETMVSRPERLQQWLSELARNDQLPDVAFFTETQSRYASNAFQDAGITPGQVPLIGLGFLQRPDANAIDSGRGGLHVSLLASQDITLEAYMAILQVCMTRSIGAPGLQIDIPLKIIGFQDEGSAALQSDSQRFVQFD